MHFNFFFELEANYATGSKLSILKGLWVKPIESNRVVRELQTSRTRAQKMVRIELESSFEPNQFLSSRVELRWVRFDSTHFQPYI